MLAFDGANFSNGAFEFARRLNDLAPVLVTGVFVPQTDFANLWSYAPAAGAGVGPAFVPLLEEEETDDVNKNIRHFEELCQKNGLAYRVHKDYYDFALYELKHESRYSDVMIISGELFYSGVMRHQFDYLRELLHNTSCPVIVVPEDYQFPENNILAYDGSEESVYAIKQFSYIFPELAKNKTLLVYSEDERSIKFPAHDYITELVTQHYPDLTFYKLEIDPKKYFKIWISEKKTSIVVSGSFGRSGFSQMFKKSFVTDIIKEHKVPVFIAHK